MTQLPYDSLHCLMTPCTTLSNIGLTTVMAMITSRSKNHVQLPVSQNVQWTFDFDHITIVKTCIALLTIVLAIVLSYIICKSNIHIGSFIISPPSEESGKFEFILCTDHHYGPPGTQHTQFQPHARETGRDMRRHTES